MHEAANGHIGTIFVPRMGIPPSVPATSEEIERRRKVVERMLRVRKRIGPIDIRDDDLLHESGTESER